MCWFRDQRSAPMDSSNLYKVSSSRPSRRTTSVVHQCHRHQQGLLCGPSLSLSYTELPRKLPSRPLSRPDTLRLSSSAPFVSHLLRRPRRYEGSNTGRAVIQASHRPLTYSSTSSSCPSMSKHAMPARMWRHGIHSFLEVHRFHHHFELLLMTCRSGDKSSAQDRVQSYLWGTTQQGNTFVPGQETRQDRANRVNTTIQAVDRHFPGPYVAQQGNGASADLNGVGQQFHTYTRH